MSEKASVLSDQPVVQLTVRPLKALIAAVVQRVVREELCRDYYVDTYLKTLIQAT